MSTYNVSNMCWGWIITFVLILSIVTKIDASDKTDFIQDIEEIQSRGNEEIQEPFSFEERELKSDSTRIHSGSNAPHEVSASSDVDTWEEMSEKVLCSSGKAVDIRDALNQAFPGFAWYVLVQDENSGYATSFRGDYHKARNTCQKNMVVWRGQPGMPKCSTEAEDAAQLLIDSATLNADDSGTIIDTVREREAGYGLDHYIAAAWDGVTDTATILQQSCFVRSSDKASYYIYTFDPTTTTTRKTTETTTSRTTDATTRRTQSSTKTSAKTTRRTTEKTTGRTQSSTKTTAKTTRQTTEKTTSRTAEATTKSTTAATPWEDMADSYLCSSGQAKNILDALDEFYPGMDWYVFVQDIHSNWTGSMPRGESHQADNLCQKNMVVWRQPSSGKNCSEDTAASALSLINNATGIWDQAEAITDYIVTGEAEYGLYHDMTASWDDLSAATDWASKVQSTCHVDNNRTLYYISTSSASAGPYTMIGHTLCILMTTVVFAVAI